MAVEDKYNLTVQATSRLVTESDLLSIYSSGRSRRSARGEKQVNLPPTVPYLGPPSEQPAYSPDDLEACVEAAEIAADIAIKQLRAALRRRQGLGSESSTPVHHCSSPDADYDLDHEAMIPPEAVFPFPEPIPHAMPSRRPQSQVGHNTNQLPGVSRPTSRAMCSRPVSQASSKSVGGAAKEVCVPAVFPFPEPIPHAIPTRREADFDTTSTTLFDTQTTIRPTTSQVTSSSGTKRFVDHNINHFNEGQMKKLEVRSPEFLESHKQRANGWLHETTPRTVYIPRNKRPGWLIQKRDDEKRRMLRNTALRDMPCLPFDLWLEMKDLEHLDRQGGRRPDPEILEQRKLFYQSLGEERRAFMQGRYVPFMATQLWAVEDTKSSASAKSKDSRRSTTTELSFRPRKTTVSVDSQSFEPIP